MSQNYTPELQIQKFELGTIETNLNELEIYVKESLKKYQNLTYTDDQIREAKVDRKNLNSLSKKINSWRIEKEKEFMEPFLNVKNQCRRITDSIDEVSGEIDSQVKAYENNRKAQKKEEITAYWASIRVHNIPIDMVMEEKWLNVTCSEREWKTALENVKRRITADLASFANYQDVEMTDFMITDYMKTLDVQQSLQNWQAQVEAKERAEEAKRQAEAVRAAREEKARQEAEAKAQREAETVTPEETKADGPRDYLYSPTFKMIDLTYDQAMALTNYMKENGLRFESIAKEKRRK